MSEVEIMRKIQVAASKLGARLFRNNTGMGWAGKATVIHKTMQITLGRGDVVIRQARPLHAGLCEGSSDLIGWTPKKISQADVGKTVAIFTANEVKTTTGRLSETQKKFLAIVNESGGIGVCTRSVEETTDVISKV